ncbi:MAG: GNAT family N-acetyltransferase [Clostridia bacterium]|nr:GNAT family N-acetyltransferase [Clostridia bacterium]
MSILRWIKQRKYYKRTPVLETERLILRPITPEDAEAAFVWLSDERVNKFMPYNLYKNTDEVLYWINVSLPKTKDFSWGLALKENNVLIGSGSIRFKEKYNAWNFGYNLNFDYWGNGYATEAAKRMIEYAYEELGARDFCATHATDNPASGRVLEKCGLVFDRYDEYCTFDGKHTFKAKFYKMHLD